MSENARTPSAATPAAEETAAVRPVLSSSPHIAASENVTHIMLWVVAALAPSVLLSVWYMRGVALGVYGVTIAACLATEGGWNALRKRPQTLADGSALVTGLLLAMTLPPRTPLWIAAAGGFVAIALAKMLFGGLGWNLFNPALVGRAFVLLSWPGVMAAVRPYAGGWFDAFSAPGSETLDAISGATRLALAAADRAADGAYGFDLAAQYRGLLWNNTQGCLGEVSAGLLIIGGLVLIVKGIIDWRIPAGYIGTVALLSWAFGSDPTFNVLAGGVMLGAFFMATDYVTSPMTRWGRLVFAVGCGALNVIGRFFGPMPESTTYAILFMNGLVPLIDRGFRPRTFGWEKRGG